MSFAYRIIDASESADYGLEAMQRWPDNNGLMYQVHRTLLWAGRVDEAAQLAQRFTELFDDNPMVQARQACAEGRVQDVLDFLAITRSNSSDPDSLEWLILLLLDDRESAEAIPRRFESDGSLQALVSWLVYHKFDPSPFPSLMAVLERENVDRPPPVEMPYTCPPSAL